MRKTLSGVKMGRSSVGWVAVVSALACAMACPFSPAQAYEAKEVQPFVICSAEIRSNELLAQDISLRGPANGATVPAGTPVAFSGESSRRALTFSVASSPALLSSPDIDSGPGLLQTGTSLYTFTSTKVTATPRTVYWAASFTLTPKDCEGPTTFTTPTRTITVLPSPTEGPATNKPEEEAAVTDSVSLDGSTLTVQSNGQAQARLACTGSSACTGKLLLTVKGVARKGKKAKTHTIATGSFAVPAGKAVTIELKPSAAGRALLRATHGRLIARLTVLKSSPAPSQTDTESVRLVQQKTVKVRGDKRS